MAKGIITMCEVGVLLDKSHCDFDFYSRSWTHEYGFYNENNILYQSQKEAREYARRYVKNGVENTYAIVSNEGECHWDEPFDDSDLSITARGFDASDIIYCVAKINGKVVEDEDFLNLSRK